MLRDPDLAALESLRQRLRRVADTIRAVVPNGSSDCFEHQQGSILQICVSVIASPTAETLDLCCEIDVATTPLVVTGDLVVGGSGEILAELTTLLATGSTARTRLPEALTDFIEAQERRMFERLLQP